MKMTKLTAGLFFLMTLLGTPSGFASEEDETNNKDDSDIAQSCENEARAAGMVSSDEVRDYIDQCIAEMAQLEDDSENSSTPPRD